MALQRTPIDPDSISLGGKDRDQFQRIARIAEAQDGVVTRRGMLDAGVREGVIARLLARGVLLFVYRSVYSVGHSSLSELGRWRAGLLLGGEGACLSHTSAAQIHRLLDDVRFAHPGMIHVTRSFGGGAGVKPALMMRQPAARIHRSQGLRQGDVVRRFGLAVTSVERTLTDLAGILSRRKLESVVLKSQRLGLLDVPQLAQRLDGPKRGTKGIATLRELIEGAVPTKGRTLSDPEAWMIDLIRRHDIPQPAVNVPVEGFMVDFYWREAKLIVEFDGHLFHSSRQAMRRDKRRDRTLQLAGYRVLRYTYEDLSHEPRRVAAEIADALSD